MNGLPRDTMPALQHDDLDNENLQVLSAFLSAMTAAGMQMDDTLEDALRTKANLPLKPRTAETEHPDQPPPGPPGKMPPAKPGQAGGGDEGDGLTDAAPEASGTKPPAKRSSKPGQVAKAAPDDIEALGRVLPDDPAYREALAVLAGGPILGGIDAEKGGAPAAGPSPFHQALMKHNRYHDARGRFTFGPENGGGNGDSVKDFLESDASGLVVVAKLPADIQAHLGAKTTRVFLSSDTRDSHKKHKWTSEDFALLQKLLDHGEVRTDRDNHVVVAHMDGIWRCAVVKVTGDRKEVYLSSFHRMRAKQVYDFPNKGSLIRVGKKV